MRTSILCRSKKDYWNFITYFIVVGLNRVNCMIRIGTYAILILHILINTYLIAILDGLHHNCAFACVCVCVLKVNFLNLSNQ